MNKFCKGDRVIAHGFMSEIDLNGMIGTVIVPEYRYDDNIATGVQFDNFENGHNLDGSLPNETSNGFWVYCKLLNFSNKKFRLNDKVIAQKHECIVTGLDNKGVYLDDNKWYCPNSKVKLVARKALI